LELLFDRVHEGIIITNADNIIVDVNDTLCEITGYSKDELIGQQPNLLSSGKQSKAFYSEMWQSLSENGFWRGEVWNRKKDGSFYAEILTIHRSIDPLSGELFHLGLVSDITMLKQHQAELERLAHYDALTALPNRNLLADRFEQAIAHSNRTQTLLAVCFLDLDNFKPVNDELGHNAGDELLIEVAQRIRTMLRQDDTVSRYGGDEFVMLLGEIKNRQDCEQLLHRLTDELSRPYQIENKTIRISASIGYTVYPFDQGSMQTLIEHADQTLYKAKLDGKKTFRMYETGNEAWRDEKNEQLYAIRRALTENEFQLFLQPKINMCSGEVIGFEALIRWQHPDNGLMFPQDFLPLINGTSLEIQLGEWVIRQALHYLQQWQAQSKPWHISINLSAYHLGSNGFLQRLNEIIAEFPTVDLQYFQFEILESHALDDLSLIVDVVRHCREEFNIKTVLDDFGTGYSSLSHIRTLPVSAVKIDQTFVRNMLADVDDCKIVEGVIALARSFDLEVIAEGVESVRHGQILLSMGCELAQGYVIAKPMPAAHIADWQQQFTLPEDWLSYRDSRQHIKWTQLNLFCLYLQLSLESVELRFEAELDDVNLCPIISIKQSHCGVWLDRTENLQLIDMESLQILKEKYRSFHHLLTMTLKLYQAGKKQSGLQNLHSLRSRYQDIYEYIQSIMSAFQPGEITASKSQYATNH
jgi:diguanylate cyclase (GGDEF)-like protein/PAS domain S-box-containing protein|tara:strand:- start:41653 stop:43746 length:2094 start_codon:yes stop_codon:yes gene_type:complete